MSVVVTSGLYYMHLSVNRWLENRAADRARKTLDRAINSPNVPEAEKEKFRKQLAEFEQGVVARELERVQLVGSPPAP